MCKLCWSLSEATKEFISWAAAAKAGGADKCISILQGDTGDLEQGRGRVWSWSLLASLVSAEDFSKALDPS